MANNVTSRPYVILRSAMSLDGYIDDASNQRLLLSNEADFDSTDEVRSGCDAIFVGAGTVRRDNPRLIIRSPARVADRLQKGMPANPVKVTWSQSDTLDPLSNFFQLGDGAKFLYCPQSVTDALRTRLGSLAEIIPMEENGPAWLLEDLFRRGIGRLLVEGGSRTNTQFLQADLVDELHVSIAPFFVGDLDAPRLNLPASYPQDQAHPFVLEKVTQFENVVELRYRRNH